MDSFLFLGSLYLAMAVIAVPAAMRLGFGSVLGYLVAGLLMGPVFGMVGADAQDLQSFAEFGVVMMLFLIGLDLEPRALWQMRHQLLGLGGAQLVLTTLAFMALAMLIGVAWGMALAIGLILALSSTAIVLQTLSEKGLMQTRWGRSAFSVLLLQDIAVIPIIALLPLLAVAPPIMPGPEGSIQHLNPDVHDAEHAMSLAEGLPGWGVALVAFIAILAVLLVGTFLAGPIFRHIHATRLKEMHIAFALLIVVGTSMLMLLVGMSPALGAFLAGIVLANSAFRHDLAADIEPFKGLLMGLFFITVGAGMDLALLFSEPARILTMTAVVILVKIAVLWVLGRAFDLKGGDQWLLALSLAQAGEFGFVLVSFSAQTGVLPAQLSQTLLLVITLSMVVSPVLLVLAQRLTGRSLGRSAADKIGDLKVFLSYSRLDADRMQEVAGCLESSGFTVLYDSRSLPFAEKWKAELRYLIEQADVVVWLISRSSIESYWCNWELGEISTLGKKLVPCRSAIFRRTNCPATLKNVRSCRRTDTSIRRTMIMSKPS